MRRHYWKSDVTVQLNSSFHWLNFLAPKIHHWQERDFTELAHHFFNWLPFRKVFTHFFFKDKRICLVKYYFTDYIAKARFRKFSSLRTIIILWKSAVSSWSVPVITTWIKFLRYYLVLSHGSLPFGFLNKGIGIGFLVISPDQILFRIDPISSCFPQTVRFIFSSNRFALIECESLLQHFFFSKSAYFWCNIEFRRNAFNAILY